MRWFVCSLLIAGCSAPAAPAPTSGPPPVHWDRHRDAIPLIDSHVHLALYPVADQLAEHGIRAAVDLASPESALGTKYPIVVIQAGPMLTHPNGYPLDSWGSDGYGIGCDTPTCVMTTIERVQAKGARVIKIALDDDGLDPKLARWAVMVAHRRHLKVAVHALTDAGARVGGEIEADVLAHTPLEPLSAETIAAWSPPEAPRSIDGMHVDLPPHRQRAVITTLAAFGGSPTAIDNLRKLRAAGVTVLYGTDLGNLRVDGPSVDEIALMKQAGMTDDEVQNAMTIDPWDFWGFGALGPIPGKPAVQAQ